MSVFFWRKPQIPEPQYLGRGRDAERIAELEDICRAWRDDYSGLKIEYDGLKIEYSQKFCEETDIVQYLEALHTNIDGLEKTAQEQAVKAESDKALIKTLRGQLQKARARGQEELSDIVTRITPEAAPLFNRTKNPWPNATVEWEQEAAVVGPIEKGIPLPRFKSPKTFYQGDEKGVPLWKMQDGDSVFIQGIGASLRHEGRARRIAKKLGIAAVSRVIDTPTQQGRRIWRFDERTKK
jgi:hypothetical protein